MQIGMVVTTQISSMARIAKDGRQNRDKRQLEESQEGDRLHQIEQPKLQEEIAFEINRERSQVLKVFAL